MDRVLVTGGAGFIGQRTALALNRRGYAVRLFDQLASRVHAREEWPDGLTSSFECVRGDVRARDELLNALRGVVAVVHLAAYQDYLPDFSTFLTTNAAATALLYELIVSERLPIQRVVIASSQAVYGEGAYACDEHGLQFPNARSLDQLERRDWEIRCKVCAQELAWRPTDETVVNPQNPYGISKLSQELVGIHLGRRYGIPTVALRYSITQGAGQSFRNAYSGICRIFSSCAIHGQPFPVYEDGQQRRDYVYVEDVVAANVLALTGDCPAYEVFNVGGQEAISVLDYARVVSTVAGVDLPIDLRARFRVGDTRHVVSTSGKLRALGWRQTKSVAEIVQEYLDWARLQAPPKGVTETAQAEMRRLGAVRTAG